MHPSTGHRTPSSPRNLVAVAPLHMRRTAAVRQNNFRSRRAIFRCSWRLPDVSALHPSFVSTCSLCRSPRIQLYISSIVARSY